MNKAKPPVPATRAIEEWLRREVISACDWLKPDPSRARSSDQVRAHIAQTLNVTPDCLGTQSLEEDGPRHELKDYVFVMQVCETECLLGATGAASAGGNPLLAIPASI